MYLFQCESSVQKDTDHFTEEEKKASGMQLQILRHCSGHELTHVVFSVYLLQDRSTF
jgi:hypothetical protein